MAYGTQADLIARYGEPEIIQASDRDDPPSGAIDSASVDRALDDASSEIDSYLATRYTVPVASPPNVLKAAELVVARYRLHDDRATDRIRDDYKSIISWLRDVSTGKASLPGVADASAGATTDPGGGNFGPYAVRAPDAVFVGDTMDLMQP